MPATPFVHRHRVSYSECTVGNHVYYARYLDLLEEARGEFFRSLGAPMAALQERGVNFPVTECHVRYRSAARYDDQLRVEVWLMELGRVRIGFGHRVQKADGTLVLECETVHACATLDEKPQRVPADLAEKLRQHLDPGRWAAAVPQATGS